MQNKAPLCVWISCEARSDVAAQHAQIDTETGKKKPAEREEEEVGAVRKPSNSVPCLCANKTCVTAHFGLVAVTTVVVWRLPHVKLYGHGVLFVWVVVQAAHRLLASLQTFCVLPHDTYCKHTGPHTHPNHTIPRVCSV